MPPRARAGAAVFDNACRLFAAMEDQAVAVGDLDNRDAYLTGMIPKGGCLGIWLGSLTGLCTSLGMPSTSAYHETKLALVQMRCMSLLRRDAGQRSSAWALLQRPTRELWQDIYGPLERLTKMERARANRAAAPEPELLTPEQITEAVRARVNSLMLRAIDGLADVLEHSNNSQAVTAAARTILALSREGSTLEHDPLARLADQLASEIHATAGLNGDT
jgi:hypothetical protein